MPVEILGEPLYSRQYVFQRLRTDCSAVMADSRMGDDGPNVVSVL